MLRLPDSFQSHIHFKLPRFMSPSSSSAISEGFTALPHSILDLLLCHSLSKRDLSILLLVVRLTYGCRNARWAHLRQTDLATVGISSNHAKDCLHSLLSRTILIQNGIEPEYRLNVAFLAVHIETETSVRLDLLSGLIGRHLWNSQKGNFAAAPRPQKGTRLFPNREVFPSPKGNIAKASRWSFSRSSRQFEKDFDSS